MPSSPARRLRELGETHGLNEAAVDALGRMLEVLATDPTAPTTVTHPSAAVDVHLADSLTGLDVERVRGAEHLADVGAGAGFPGVALAAALPGAQVTEVESVGRKAAFIRRLVDAAGLANAAVVHARVEEWRAGLDACDVVTARAVAPLGVLVEYAAPLLRPGGVLVAWKGARDDAEEQAGAAAGQEAGLEPAGVLAVRPFPAAEHRHLHLYEKVRSTPSRFPRRPGMARKRPLGGSTST